jgi:hypothetical protein
LCENLDIFHLPVTLPASGEATIQLNVYGRHSHYTFEEKVLIDNSQPPYHGSFPVYPWNDYMSPGYFRPYAPLCLDMNGDGKKELVISGTAEGYRTRVFVYRSDGTALYHWGIEDEILTSSPAAGDLNDDGYPEIVLRTRRPGSPTEKIRIYSHEGVEITAGWPKPQVSPMAALSDDEAPDKTPVLADVTLDGRPDILVSLPKAEGYPGPRIDAFDFEGQRRASYLGDASQTILTMPACGDIDQDGEIEIAAIGFPFVPRSDEECNATLYVWKRDGTLRWAAPIDAEKASRVSPPVLVDANNDGYLEVVTVTSGHFARVFSHLGAELRQTQIPYQLDPKPIAAQCDPGNDPGNVSVLFTACDSSGTYRPSLTVKGAMDQSLPAGFPLIYAEGNVNDAPIVADISEAPGLEPAVVNSSLFPCGCDYKLGIYTRAGVELRDADAFPLYFRESVYSSPLVADLDGDGKLELIVQTGPYSSEVFVFDLSSPAGAGKVAWGEYAHDPHRSSNYNGDLAIRYPATEKKLLLGPANLACTIRTRFITESNPEDAATPTSWKVRIGGREAAVTAVSRSGADYKLNTMFPQNPADGDYDLSVEYNNGGIRSWASYRSAIAYDSTPPSGSIVVNGGAGTTDSREVTLALAAADDHGITHMQFSSDLLSWSAPEPYAHTRAWTLTGGNGLKRVYVKYRDGAGNWSRPFGDRIFLGSGVDLDLTCPATIRQGQPIEFVLEFINATAAEKTVESIGVSAFQRGGWQEIYHASPALRIPGSQGVQNEPGTVTTKVRVAWDDIPVDLRRSVLADRTMRLSVVARMQEGTALSCMNCCSIDVVP